MTPQEIKEHKALLYDLENDLYFFCRYFFHAINGSKWVRNWHHEVITDTFTKISNYKIGNTVINIPPRYGKTEIGVVMFIAWCMAKNPKARFIHLSYSDDLALDNSGKIKEIILSDEYQKFWPLKLKADSQSKKKWYTEQGGGMYASAAGGTVRGFGAGSVEDGPGNLFGGAIILDDPLKGGAVFISSKELELVNGRLNTTLSNRRNSHSYTPIIIIMQRLHVDDMSGFVLGNGMNEKFHHIKLSAIQPDGKSLWPAKHSLEQLKDMQKADSFVFAGQYLQEPVPLGGAMFKLEWLKYYDYTEVSWQRFNPYILVDAANEKKKRSDYTAMVVVCLGSDRNYYIADIVRDRLNPTERIATLMELHEKWLRMTGKPPKIGYEKYGKDSDTFYLAEAQRQQSYYMNVVELGGQRSKVDRVSGLVPLFESSRIYLPKNLVYIDQESNARRDLVKEFIDDEYLLFSMQDGTARHDDMLDALARMLDPAMSCAFPIPKAGQKAYDGWKYQKDKIKGNNNGGWLNA